MSQLDQQLAARSEVARGLGRQCFDTGVEVGECRRVFEQRGHVLVQQGLESGEEGQGLLDFRPVQRPQAHQSSQGRAGREGRPAQAVIHLGIGVLQNHRYGIGQRRRAGGRVLSPRKASRSEPLGQELGPTFGQELLEWQRGPPHARIKAEGRWRITSTRIPCQGACPGRVSPRLKHLKRLKHERCCAMLNRAVATRSRCRP
jgi:hypothetical protein